MRKLSTNDFIWSVRLGVQLRVFSYDVNFKFEWATWKNGIRYPKYKIIECNSGECVLGYTHIDESKMMFWTIKVSDLEKNIQDKKFYLNSIPDNWRELIGKN